MTSGRSATTSQVGQALGLRAATVQAYARNGRIPFDLTPGGHRRFNIGEVRAALAGAADTAAETDRRRPRGWLADALDLSHWSETREAQHQAPRLLRKLVLATSTGLRALSVRVDEGVQLPGWDLVVEADNYTRWVPEGTSAWEIGTGEDVTSKANNDYDRRSTDPLGLDPSETAYLFVTTRRWERRDAWAAAKRREGRWRDVRAYDSDNLEEWLEAAPAVHAWITQQIGRSPDDVEPLGFAWQKWTQRTAPPLPRSVLLQQREELVGRLLASLAGQPTSVGVQAGTQDEALGLVLATLVAPDLGDAEQLEARTLVVHTADAWAQILQQSEAPLILIPTFDSPQTSEAVDLDHHVLAPLEAGGGARGEVLEVPRLRRQVLLEGLIEAGLPEHEAERLARIGRRSLMALRRQLAVNAQFARPDWAHPDNLNEPVVALLAGSWRDDEEGDREVLGALAGGGYEEFMARLQRWAAENDPVARRSGATWYIVSREDAWELLGRSILDRHFNALREVALNVLAKADPVFELDVDRRWAADIYGKRSRWSLTLRTGIAETLAVIGTRAGTQVMLGTATGQTYVDSIVREILGQANRDGSATLWKSLSNHLPLLAEASPSRFLDAVDEGLFGDTPVLSQVFDPETERSLFGSPTHTGLLWALETLGWSSTYLHRVAALLARLASVDVNEESRWVNRPRNSLREIFLPWRPETTASLDVRLESLDLVVETDAAVGWTLLLSLLPKHHDNAFQSHRPVWREWSPEDRAAVTNAEYFRHVTWLVGRLLGLAENFTDRWIDLMEAMPNLPIEERCRVTDALERVFEDPVEDPRPMIAVLRKLVARHRRFPAADWSLPSSELDRLEMLLQATRLEDPVERLAWLFAPWPDLALPEIDDYDERRQRITEEQQRAMREVLSTGLTEDLWRLAGSCPAGRVAGEVLASVADKDRDVVPLVNSAIDDRRALASGYVSGRFREKGWDWADGVLESLELLQGPEEQASFLLSLWADARTLEWVERLGEEVSARYWERMYPYIHVADERSVEHAARKLCDAGRASDAVVLIATALHGSTELGVAHDVVVSTLTAVGDISDVSDYGMFPYYTSQLLDWLVRHGNVDRSTLASLEWRYLEILDDRDPSVLFDELRSNPGFFAELVSWIYVPDDDVGGDEHETREVLNRAALAHSLLSRWRTPPGVSRGVLKGAVLERWVMEARERLAEQRRVKAGDLAIGKILQRTPGDDIGWPAVPVKRLLEALRNPDIEHSMEIEAYNSRGVTMKSPMEGGASEWALARRYRDWQAVSSRYPRTSALLGRIAESWEADARREDQSATLREDLGR